MEGSESPLVIILSVTLTVFLVLAIIALIKVIQIIDQIKRISDKAEKIVETAESVGEFFKYSSGPAAIGRLIANIADAVFRKTSKKGDK